MSTSKICIGKNGTCAVRRSRPALHLPGPGKGFTIAGSILWNVAANSAVSTRRRRKNRQVKCNSAKGTGRLKGSVGNSLPAVSYRGDAGRQERTARSYRKEKVIGNRSGAGDALPRSTGTSPAAGGLQGSSSGTFSNQSNPMALVARGRRRRSSLGCLALAFHTYPSPGHGAAWGFRYIKYDYSYKTS